jgi:hypothetical protein
VVRSLLLIVGVCAITIFFFQAKAVSTVWFCLTKVLLPFELRPHYAIREIPLLEGADDTQVVSGDSDWLCVRECETCGRSWRSARRWVASSWRLLAKGPSPSPCGSTSQPGVLLIMPLK